MAINTALSQDQALPDLGSTYREPLLCSLLDPLPQQSKRFDSFYHTPSCRLVRQAPVSRSHVINHVLEL